MIFEDLFTTMSRITREHADACVADPTLAARLDADPKLREAHVEKLTGRPFIDPEIDTHEGFSDEELAALLDTQATRLDKLNMRGMAFDIRGAANRLRKRT